METMLKTSLRMFPLQMFLHHSVTHYTTFSAFLKNKALR